MLDTAVWNQTRSQGWKGQLPCLFLNVSSKKYYSVGDKYIVIQTFSYLFWL